MAEPDVEAAWRAEFKRIGETVAAVAAVIVGLIGVGLTFLH